ncbi:hypothetical protein QE152_g12815 [Popillia japonica]|uniref:Endonuclease/exonuclease/phosphatase domain-containing protein n=1 Tax=Popillia japonica TaxID=7064 RepID=A0AAW1LDR5_POPJA
MAIRYQSEPFFRTHYEELTPDLTLERLNANSRNNSTRISGDEFGIFYQNVQCLTTSLASLTIELNLLPHCKVVFVTEHWLVEERIKLTVIPGFRLLASYCRRNSIHGGSAIYLKDDCQGTPSPLGIDVATEGSFEYCATDVFHSGRHLLLLCIYRSPNSDLNDFFTKFDYLLNLISQNRIIALIAGDFNIDLMSGNNNSNKFVNILESYGAYTTFREPTRISKTTQTCLDNIIIINNSKNSNFSINSTTTIATGYSDHMALLLAIIFKTNHTSYSTIIPKKVRLINETTINKFISLMSHESWSDVYNERYNVDEKFSIFLNIFTRYFNSCFPLKSVSRNASNPTIPNHLIRLKNTVSALQIISNHSNEYRDTYLYYKKMYDSEFNSFQQRCNDKYLLNSNNKSRSVWRIINKNGS